MNLTRTFAIVGLTLAILITGATVSAQDKIIPQGAIKTADGFIFIKNTKGKSFMLELKGKEVTTPKNETDVPMFFVDGRVVQIVTADTANFAPAAAKEEEVLELHKKWESDFLGTEVYKTKLQVESEKLSVGDRKALFWGFKRPDSDTNFDRDYFLTTTFGQMVLAVGSPIKLKEDLAAYKTLLTQVMSTLKISDKPYDILKMAEEIRKAAPKN